MRFTILICWERYLAEDWAQRIVASLVILGSNHPRLTL